MALEFQNLSLSELRQKNPRQLTARQRAELIKKEAEEKKRNEAAQQDDPDAGTRKATDEEIRSVLDDHASSWGDPFPSSGNWSARDLVHLGSAGYCNPNKPYNYEHIRPFYRPLAAGETANDGIAASAKFMAANLDGVSEADWARYDKLGVRTDRAWCMNFVNATLRLRGLKTTGSDAAASAAGLGQQVSASEAKPGCIIERYDGHHVGIMMGRTADGRILMLSGNHGGAVRYSVVSPNYGIFIAHSGERDPSAIAFDEKLEGEKKRLAEAAAKPKATLADLKGDPLAATPATGQKTAPTPAAPHAEPVAT
jgi:uncharacterized protein (TIGR02594 family)